MAANLPPAARSSSRPPRPRSSASEFSHPEAGRPATATRRSNRDIDRHSTRDRDLVAADALLTDTALDDLWEWFTREVHDPQLMFVKMVNAVRKPYVEHIRTLAEGQRPGDMYMSTATSTVTASAPAAGDVAKPDLDLTNLLGTGDNDAQASAIASGQTVSVPVLVPEENNKWAWEGIVAAKNELIRDLLYERERAKENEGQVDNEIIIALCEEVERAKQKEAQVEKEIIIPLRDEVERAKQKEAQVEKEIIIPLRDEVESSKHSHFNLYNEISGLQDDVKTLRDQLERAEERETKALKESDKLRHEACELKDTFLYSYLTVHGNSED